MRSTSHPRCRCGTTVGSPFQDSDQIGSETQGAVRSLLCPGLSCLGPLGLSADHPHVMTFKPDANGLKSTATNFPETLA